ncbi:MAG: penicillin-binding transpeptidase domain-containing protein, partial [Chloroflexota bacterium]
MTSFTREINRLLIGVLSAFGVIFIAATYYAVVGNMTLLPREDNPRLVEAERSIMRGSLYDRDGMLLVRTIQDDNNFAQRELLAQSMASATGYYSFRYGSAGAEAAYDDLLSGADQPATPAELILNQPRQGADIRLTFDLDIQQAIVEAMGDQQGAAVVMSVPGGEMLALVSLPTYDPNTLDADWDTLIESEGEPFFNRALQGRYQPGTMLHLPVVLTALVKGQTLNVQFPNGTVPIQLDDLTLTCLLPPSGRSMNMREAYLYGCPAPFAQIAPSLGLNEIRETFNLLQLENAPVIDGFVGADETIRTTFLTRGNLRENVLGQGDLTVSPIGMNALTAAIINNGNAPQPYAIQAINNPGDLVWAPIRTQRPTAAYMTDENARRLAEIMRESAIDGTGAMIKWGELDVGSHAAIAYSGDEAIVWFTAFVVLENKPNVAITVVIEGTEDPMAAATVAHDAILAADAALPAIDPTPAP